MFLNVLDFVLHSDDRITASCELKPTPEDKKTQIRQAKESNNSPEYEFSSLAISLLGNHANSTMRRNQLSFLQDVKTKILKS